MLARMIRPLERRVAPMICRNHQQILIPQQVDNLRQLTVKIRQRIGKPLRIAAVAVEHVRIHQIREAQPVKRLAHVVQPRLNARGIPGGVVRAGQAAQGENVLNFAHAVGCHARILHSIKQRAAERLHGKVAAAAGALAGLTLDLCGTGELYLAVVLCAAASAAAGLRRGQRVPAAAAFCAAGVLAALLLGEVRPLAVLCQLLTAAGVWLLLPEKEGPLLTAAGEVSPEAAAPAAAFRAVYDSLEDHAPLLRPENPAVLFDRAAEQVCRDCPLRSDCWQTHYTDTYNAFNDACPALLRRGQALAEDFPPYFAARCVRFPKLLTALDGQLHDFLQRRLHHGRLDAAYRLAREQYRQVAEVLSRTAPAERLRRAHLTCRTAALLRPKTGEKHCGDQCAAFDAGGLTCLALSDGMGSGESAHCEAAMTIRLLRQFLQAGIEPLPALKTLNTAAMLRCQGGAGFTTIDLACLDRAEGVLTLYKYGAAPSYIKRQGAVARYRAQALPAGLESADGDVPPQRVAVSPGTWLVQVSDGVAGEDDEWLQDLLAGWDGTSPRALAEELLRQSVQRTGGADDCAVLVMAIDGKADPHRV
mgnify:CR=1 FL=1